MMDVIWHQCFKTSTNPFRNYWFLEEGNQIPGKGGMFQ